MLADERSQAAKNAIRHHRCVNTRLEHTHGMIAEVEATKLQIELQVVRNEVEQEIRVSEENVSVAQQIGILLKRMTR